MALFHLAKEFFLKSKVTLKFTKFKYEPAILSNIYQKNLKKIVYRCDKLKMFSILRGCGIKTLFIIMKQIYFSCVLKIAFLGF